MAEIPLDQYFFGNANRPAYVEFLLRKDSFGFFDYSPPQDLVGGDAGEGVRASYLKLIPSPSSSPARGEEI
jgi:hypothetical protein